MPSFDVSVSLKIAIHRNARHRWKNNHVHDIHPLTATLPYCDIVVTDREMASMVRRSKFDRRLVTAVLDQLEDLASHLDAGRKVGAECPISCLRARSLESPVDTEILINWTMPVR